MNSSSKDAPRPPKTVPISPVSLSVLLIEIYGNGQKLGTATGFVVHKNDARWFIMTNRHVVTGRHQHSGKCLDEKLRLPDKLVIHHRTESGLAWTTREESLYDDDEHSQPRWKEHPVYGGKADFVALELRNLRGTQTNSWDVEATRPVEQAIAPAMPVSVVGFPFGISYAGNYPIWATGFIASEPTLDFSGLPIVLVDCRARPGQSGSPVVKHNLGTSTLMTDGSTKIGEHMTTFIGMYSGRINDQSDIGMVWKRIALLELVNVL